MVMGALRKGASGGILKFILFGLLALAGGGLVFTDVGGFFRSGGVARNDVAKIGDETLSIQKFDSLAQRALRQFGMTPQQAYQNGYIKNILSAEIRSRLLAIKAADSGVVIGTDPIAAKVHAMLAPMVKPGDDPAVMLSQLLAAQGMSERELTETLGREMAVEILGKAVAAGFLTTSDAMIDDLGQFEKESRSLEYIAFLTEDYKEAKAATDDELKQMYEATKEAYTIPEMREGQLIIIKSGTDSDTLDVSEEEIRDAYERNISSYTESETRTIEQVILSDKNQIEQIAEKIKNGTSLKEAVKAVTKNTTDYIGPQNTDKKSLPENLSALVFSAKSGDVIGPISSALGEQIIVVKSINAEKIQPFERVKTAIKQELKETKILDARYELGNSIDDLLAGGASIEELKEHADIEIKNLPAIHAGGANKEGKPGLETYKEDAAKILQALFELNEGESTPVFELSNGTMAALTLKTITPKSYVPFEDIKEKLAAQWLSDAKRTGNKLQVLQIMSEIESEGLSLKDVAQKYKKQTQGIAKITRTAEPPKPLNPQAANSIFEAKKDSVIVIDLENGSALARVTAIKDDDRYTKEERAKAKIGVARSFENESYSLYLQKQNDDYGAAVNDSLLEQAYGARQEK